MKPRGHEVKLRVSCVLYAKRDSFFIKDLAVRIYMEVSIARSRIERRDWVVPITTL